jgi:antitoxin VapB
MPERIVVRLEGVIPSGARSSKKRASLGIYFDLYPVIYFGIDHRGIMSQTAKLFRNGRSQAVRLPADFRFPGSEVYVRRDPATGDVILSRRPDSWQDFFALADRLDIPEDFLSKRGDLPPQKRKLF